MKASDLSLRSLDATYLGVLDVKTLCLLSMNLFDELRGAHEQLNLNARNRLRPIIGVVSS